MSLILTAEQLDAEFRALGQDVGVENSPCELNLCPKVEWLQRIGEVAKERVDARKRQFPNGGASKCNDFTEIVMDLVMESRDKNPAAIKNGWGYAVRRATITIFWNENVNGISGDGDTRHATIIVRTPYGMFFLEPQTGQHELALAALDRSCLWSVGV